jgi:hypothetical protein
MSVRSPRKIKGRSSLDNATNPSNLKPLAWQEDADDSALPMALRVNGATPSISPRSRQRMSVGSTASSDRDTSISLSPDGRRRGRRESSLSNQSEPIGRSNNPLHCRVETDPHELAAAGNVKLLKMWLDEGGDPNCTKKTQKGTPLSRAASKGHVSAVALLLSKGANVQALGRQGMTPLHESAGCSRGVECIETLLKYGADVSARDSFQRTALHYANTVEIASLLLRHGADPNSSDKNGVTADIMVTSSDVRKLLRDARRALRAEPVKDRAAECKNMPPVHIAGVALPDNDKIDADMMASKEFHEIDTCHHSDLPKLPEEDRVDTYLLGDEQVKALLHYTGRGAPDEPPPAPRSPPPLVARDHEQASAALNDVLQEQHIANLLRENELLLETKHAMAAQLATVERQRDAAESMLRIRIINLEANVSSDKKKVAIAQRHLKSLQNAMKRSRSINTELQRAMEAREREYRAHLESAQKVTESLHEQMTLLKGEAGAMGEKWPLSGTQTTSMCLRCQSPWHGPEAEISKLLHRSSRKQILQSRLAAERSYAACASNMCPCNCLRSQFPTLHEIEWPVGQYP